MTKIKKMNKNKKPGKNNFCHFRRFCHSCHWGNSGFSLIEVLLYTIFVSFIIGAVLISAYNMIESTEANSGDVSIQAEANFLIRKIEWALSGIESVNSPAEGITSQTLSVDMIGAGSDNPIVFEFDSGDLTLKRGAGSEIVLNSDFITVATASFEHLPSSGDKPSAIKASFYVGEYPFETIKFLRN